MMEIPEKLAEPEIPVLNIDVLVEIFNRCPLEVLKNVRLVSTQCLQLARYSIQEKAKVTIDSEAKLEAFLNSGFLEDAEYCPFKSLTLDCSLIEKMQQTGTLDKMLAMFSAGLKHLDLKNCKEETDILCLLQSRFLAQLEGMTIGNNCSIELLTTDPEEKPCQIFRQLKCLKLPSLFGYKRTYWLLTRCPFLKKVSIGRVPADGPNLGRASVEPMLEAVMAVMQKNPQFEQNVERIEIAARQIQINENGQKKSYSSCVAAFRKKPKNVKKEAGAKVSYFN